MAKEIEKYFVKKLRSELSEYLHDFSQNNVAKVLYKFNIYLV